ncbi:ABC-ATPase domain-containing protein [Natranaerobius thermophilus]|uniref:ATPase n=1 Tax=Natranaerobius thermophilus (strain ATCC BAA-1301 / DSM 18059 / JW/NM-WN-LF) TaxID=457570 RepID=B2A260_NATTJ|nr:ABC-ATPase domain-containing protein [Natranaerobius thermophilus]ACB84865.1 ATPase [Natranaerobius thermophilus JW/NM-WN-LF]
MADLKKLIATLSRIDGKGYKAYKDIQGMYKYPDGGELYIDYVQGDPFASPSRLRFRVPMELAKFPKSYYQNKIRKIALEDYLTRAFDQAVNKAKGNRGTGKSGMIAIDAGGQEVLGRSSMVVNDNYVEARFVIGLPARGRKILGKEAIEIFEQEITKIVSSSLYNEALDTTELEEHIAVVEDQDYLRDYLEKNNYIAFVGNGAILPRRSGIDDRPMNKEEVIPFYSPENLEGEVELPNRGKVRGMFLKEGITLIVGGGYHGKSTLLTALERGVYNHLPEDGRELVVSREESVKIRAEDGRKVEKVDISPFINNLPHGADTQRFSSEDASGSTSQAANIMESLEIGAKVLLLDEDTSATNFMIRDVRMQELVAKNKEPITPLIDKIRLLYQEHQVSTVLVVGGSGDYFDVADNVIMMDHYKPYEVTGQAHNIAKKHEAYRKKEGGKSFGRITPRKPLKKGLDPIKGKKRKVAAKGLKQIQYGKQNILLSEVEQLVDTSQTRAIGDAIFYILKFYIDSNMTMNQIIDRVMEDIDKKGLDVLSGFKGHPGEYAAFRPFELASALNRLRSLHIK